MTNYQFHLERYKELRDLERKYTALARKDTRNMYEIICDGQIIMGYRRKRLDTLAMMAIALGKNAFS